MSNLPSPSEENHSSVNGTDTPTVLFPFYGESVVANGTNQGNTGFNYYVGNQWDAADLAKLASEKRPALTVNLILPIINLLSVI